MVVEEGPGIRGLEGRVVPKVGPVGRDPWVVCMGVVTRGTLWGVLGRAGLVVVGGVPVEAERLETEALSVVLKEVRGVWVVWLATLWVVPGEEGPVSVVAVVTLWVISGEEGLVSVVGMVTLCVVPGEEESDCVVAVVQSAVVPNNSLPVLVLVPRAVLGQWL